MLLFAIVDKNASHFSINIAELTLKIEGNDLCYNYTCGEGFKKQKGFN